MQLARAWGADVTAVCNARNFAFMRWLGADEVIDVTEEDFTRTGRTCDVVFDAVGQLTFSRCNALRRGGVCAATDHLWNVVLDKWTRLFGDRKVVFPIPPRFTKADMLYLTGLIEARKYKAVIDRCHPPDEVVATTQYVETKQKQAMLCCWWTERIGSRRAQLARAAVAACASR